jgi:hypothetical protein
VISGAQFMTQFLRLRMGSEMLSGAAPGSASTEQLRAQLAAGRALEIAGYELAPQLASAIERLDLAALAPESAPARWFEVNAEGKPSRSAAPRKPVSQRAPKSSCTRSGRAVLELVECANAPSHRRHVRHPGADHA